MKAVTCHNGELTVTQVADPTPETGHLLINVLNSGICGSDLHTRVHADAVADAVETSGYTGYMRSHQTVVLGHEFCGEVVGHGPGTRHALKEGTRVVAMPILRRGRETHAVGLSVPAPGSYAEQMLVQSAVTFPVPNGLATEIAALTEPMAVGLHAVRRGEVGKKQIAIVIGCGPIGLSVIALLKATGVRTVIASDYSPGRRALAEQLGADVVVDPNEGSPYDEAAARGKYHDANGLFNLAIDSVNQLRSVPFLPWAKVMRTAENLGALPQGPVIFECVGVPGVIDSVMASAPIASRVVVVGVCMGEDVIRPSIGINKEIDLRFVLGYIPTEFHQTLHLLADGKVDPSPMITGRVGLDGVAGAFDALGDPEQHAKILIDPRSSATL